VNRTVSLLVALALLSAGCGVQEYERRMLKEQERVAYLDEENRLLDEPLAAPPRKVGEKETPPPNVFLRPPRGIGSAGQAMPGSKIVFYYARTGNSPFLGVYLATETLEGKDAQKKFDDEMLRRFSSVAPVAGELGKPPLRRDDLRFRQFTAEAPKMGGEPESKVFLYFATRGTAAAAVGYRVEKGRAADAAVTQAINMSLDTLGLGDPQARQKESEHKRRKQRMSETRAR